MNEDPIGFDGKDMNFYRYVLGRILSNTDDSGLVPQSLLAGLGGCALYGTYTAFRSWWRGESKCQCGCKGVATCITGAVAGVLFAMSPNFGVSCGVSGINALYSSVISPVCDLICQQGDSRRVVCAVASGITQVLLGCLARFMQSAGEPFEAVMTTVISHIYGNVVEEICLIQNGIN
jgi:hypothetical protein